jgi:hypothetical protein
MFLIEQATVGRGKILPLHALSTAIERELVGEAFPHNKPIRVKYDEP